MWSFMLLETEKILKSDEQNRDCLWYMIDWMSMIDKILLSNLVFMNFEKYLLSEQMHVFYLNFYSTLLFKNIIHD